MTREERERTRKKYRTNLKNKIKGQGKKNNTTTALICLRFMWKLQVACTKKGTADQTKERRERK